VVSKIRHNIGNYRKMEDIFLCWLYVALSGVVTAPNTHNAKYKNNIVVTDKNGFSIDFVVVFFAIIQKIVL
jgi:hypothetical protein